MSTLCPATGTGEPARDKAKFSIRSRTRKSSPNFDVRRGAPTTHDVVLPQILHMGTMHAAKIARGPTRVHQVRRRAGRVKA